MARAKEISSDTDSGVDGRHPDLDIPARLQRDDAAAGTRRGRVRQRGMGGQQAAPRLEDILLLGVRTCRVGESAQFWVRAADDPDVRTWRITTPVESIEKIG